MNEVLQNINIMELLSAIWTVVLVPILGYAWKQAYSWLETKKLDKYATILYEEVIKSVKSVYQTTVENTKGTDAWTDEKMKEVKELAKTKAIQALTMTVYRSLKEANSDFEDYLDNIVESSIYDLKRR